MSGKDSESKRNQNPVIKIGILLAQPLIKKNCSMTGLSALEQESNKFNETEYNFLSTSQTQSL